MQKKSKKKGIPMNNIIIFDSTLRDGSHAVKQKLSLNNIEEYCSAIDDAGLYTVIVGHGNGLGASSLQVGLSAFPDEEMLITAKNNLNKTKLGAFLLPGFGTIKNDLAPALDIGVSLVCIGAHCTEADVTRQHIEYVRSREKEVYGVLMMCHMADKSKLVEQALKMQEYGAMGVILMDSAGSSTPDMTKEKIDALVEKLRIRVGFHAHNNLGLAIANSYIALKSGATIIDGTTRGFGAGAGNCQLEVIVGLLRKEEIETGIDLYKLMDASDDIVAKIMNKPQEITSLSLISGIAGVFSGFAPHVKAASERFGVDPRDIFLELGKRKVVAGQEDVIVDVAAFLAQLKDSKDMSYQIESLL
jgi:4-hydroxy 2-oxovalerate aldolase